LSKIGFFNSTDVGTFLEGKFISCKERLKPFYDVKIKIDTF